MRTFYVSMVYDLLGVYIAYTADSRRAVELYLEKQYLRDGIWKMPWCAVYTEAPAGAIIVTAKCGNLYEADYEHMKAVTR